MEAYTAFAKVYDKFMENVPYDRWGDFLHFIISKIGISQPNRYATDALESERNLVLDLGCGTGVLTEIMYDKGYDMIGVDISQEMLDVALRRKLARQVAKTEESERENDEADSDQGILYICQDMCELDLYSTIGTVYSTCDSINYLLEDEELSACFDNVANYLFPGGLFIFDFNTVHKYRDVIGERTIAENEDECSFIWDNFYDEADNINEYDLTLFIRNEDGLYEKTEETHYQRGYEKSEICKALKEAGLTVLAGIDENIIDDAAVREELICKLAAGTDKKPDGLGEVSSEEAAGEELPEDGLNFGISENSERIIIIARKNRETT